MHATHFDQSWSDDHDPLTTDAFGLIPAFDPDPITFVGPTADAPRANRIPRLPAKRAGVCRRLYCRAKVGYLTWQMRSMRARMDGLEAEMSEATELAITQARRHFHSPALQQRRRAMRLEHQALAEEWLRVRREIDDIEATL